MSASSRVLFVAAPLVARSGVFNSSRETVISARSRGLDWHLLLGVSAHAKGERAPETEGVHEVLAEPRGVRGIRAIQRAVREEVRRLRPRIIISLIPQSDIALSRLSYPWVAYLRGRPWPAAGEASRAKTLVWETLERRALRASREVWVTTDALLQGIDGVNARLVPAGIAPIDASVRDARKIIWAARFDHDKDPNLFLEAMSRVPSQTAQMFGTGPLEIRCRNVSPPNVEVVGWSSRDGLWAEAAAYVGTSTREAFGRSAVEAAMQGIPVIVSASFGAAPLLYTDANLSSRFVIDSRDPNVWAEAIRTLMEDRALYRAASSHVRHNAADLTIERSIEAIVANLERLERSEE